ncbi:hypothetical protein FBEOM_3926 [Fusarium beomiforme]|uniref:Xylanolytic transcriptional activator regulatory domain-containing protein n=1 Tax=Fusarium beomiforme TaxID=44412 RepID=A0A9P5AP60_9HYPO|nr:hypothetical protein FBEOM_3926 [Fusarium beomiforme]
MFVPSRSHAAILLLAIESCMMLSRDHLGADLVVAEAKLVYHVRSRSRAVIEGNRVHDPSGARCRDSGQGVPVLSALTTREPDLVDESVISGDVHTASDEWNNPPSIPSDTSGIPTLGSSTIYTSVPDTTSSWDHAPALSVEHSFDGSMPNIGAMTDGPWIPCNPSMANFSFPWFMEELEVPIEFADIPGLLETHERVIDNAASFPGTEPASISSRIITGAIPSSNQTFLSPEHICSSHTRPCRPFPEPQAITLQMAGVEVFGHICDIPQQAVEGLNEFYKTQQGDSTTIAIHRELLHAFVELYLEYFDPQFPLLHVSRLEDPELPWILLLAAAAVGSHFSEVQGAGNYNLALCDLLARAVEPAVSDHIMNVDITTVQSVFLLHVLWLFSGSHKEKIIMQHKGSSLVTMCWDLLGKADKRRCSSQAEIDTEKEWQAWLAQESELRLVTCVRVLECLGHIFLGTPLAFNLRDATRQLPCPDEVWKARDAIEWKRHRQAPSDSEPQRRGYSGQGESRRPSTLGPFAAKVVVLELYIDDRNLARQLHTSHALQSSLSLCLSSAPDNTIESHRLDTNKRENSLLDKAIEQFTFAKLDNNMCDQSSNDTLFHVIAILRFIPLETLHSATGWQTNKEQMIKSKTYLQDFFENSSSKARKCLWHSACIFKLTRSSRRLVCYDTLSLTVAIGYTYCYCETRTSRPQASTSTRPPIVRLDQLKERSAIEKWIENGDDGIVHLTGVGLLDGDDACVRFLRDLERTLGNQIAWHGFCRAFAGSFAQLRRGETPTKNVKDFNDDE